jgi:hypothetical protein
MSSIKEQWMNTTETKRAYRKPVLRRLGLLRRLTRFTF